MVCCIPGLGTQLDTVTAFLAPLCVTLGDIPPFRNDPCGDREASGPIHGQRGRSQALPATKIKESHSCKWIQQKRQNS